MSPILCHACLRRGTDPASRLAQGGIGVLTYRCGKRGTVTRLYSECGKVTLRLGNYPSKDTLVMISRLRLLRLLVLAVLVSLQTYNYSQTVRKNFFLLGVWSFTALLQALVTCGAFLGVFATEHIYF